MFLNPKKKTIWFLKYIQHLVNPITSNIITTIGAILQNKHVNMSNNNITRSYLGRGYLFQVYKIQIIHILSQ